jgi:hypothetical protein
VVPRPELHQQHDEEPIVGHADPGAPGWSRRYGPGRRDQPRHGAELRYADPDRGFAGHNSRRARQGQGEEVATPDRQPRDAGPDGQYSGDPHLPERLPELARLGHGHKPTRAVPGKLEDPAWCRRGEHHLGALRHPQPQHERGLGAAGKAIPPHGVADAVRLLPSVDPLGRIRHSFSPVTWNYQPAADVPGAYAQAIALPGQPIELRSDAQQLVTVALSQSFEGKYRSQGADTTSADNNRKIRLLSISTSGVTYDFEKAKKPGFTGWSTQTITNSLLSDLLPGFNLSLTHDLWRGTVGVDSAKFDPFLQSVSASFAISGSTFRSIGSIFGLGVNRRARPEQVPSSYVAESGRQLRPGRIRCSPTQQPLRQPGRAFTANFNYQLSRTRTPSGISPVTGESFTPLPARQSLGFSTNFSPTPFWSLSWSTQYNITDGKFEGQNLRLERELHEWRAAFSYAKNPGGNFAFYFTIFLTDLPDLKFDYDQTTIEQ